MSLFVVVCSSLYLLHVWALLKTDLARDCRAVWSCSTEGLRRPSPRCRNSGKSYSFHTFKCAVHEVRHLILFYSIEHPVLRDVLKGVHIKRKLLPTVWESDTQPSVGQSTESRISRSHDWVSLPRACTVVGASPEPGEMGGNTVHQVVSPGPRGRGWNTRAPRRAISHHANNLMKN